jgi:mono/diheme cytochrome c family protein
MNDVRSQRGVMLAVVLGLLLLSGCGKPAYRTARDGEFPLVENEGRPESVKDFTKLFNTHCRGCHGPDGRDGAAPPLNDPLFLAIVPEEELRRVISEGRKDTLMPAFAHSQGGPLTSEQVDILVEELHSPVKWKKAELPADAPDYLLSDALKKAGKPGDAEEGSGVFAMSCAACHGDKGQGDHAGPLNDPAFLALTSDQMLRRIVITGRHDLNMPPYNRRDPDEFKKFKPLTNQDVADVVAFLATWRKPGLR